MYFIYIIISPKVVAAINSMCNASLRKQI